LPNLLIPNQRRCLLGWFSMSSSIILLDPSAVERALARIAHEITERNAAGNSITLVGIPRGGVHLAHRLSGLLGTLWGHAVPTGCLDVSMHRDDIDQRVAREIHPTTIPFDITGKTVVLVDDVLFSGRTVRAAMDALNDFGRPQAIQLAVLVDRGHRELPIKADYVGKNVPTSKEETINVSLKEDGGMEGVYLEKP
jgi:pyrimidine operon attenuation protein / uracil phosphoribosyltransferase